MQNKRILRILQLTDIHGAASHLSFLEPIIKTSDLIVISGDITHFGGRKEASEIIDMIRKANQNILSVSGNCDYPDVEEYLAEQDISLHRRIYRFKGFAVCGISGSLPCPGTTPFEYTETTAEKWLEELSQNIDPLLPLLFICHQPPIDTLNDDIGNNAHVGSNSVRNFISKTQPILCLTGHIHEGIGIDKIGQCNIINPGPFRSGKYARINLGLEDNPAVEIKIEQITASHP